MDITNKVEKKTYEAPTLISYGSVEKLTKQGGGSQTDVPFGTPATDISAITS